MPDQADQTDDRSFRARVLEEIAASNLKLAQIARESGVSYNVLVKLKRGDSQSTSAENAEKLRQYFDLDETTALVGLRESAPPPAFGRLKHELVDGVRPVQDPALDHLNEFEITTTPRTIRISGTFDRKGIDDLIDHLRTLQKTLRD